MIDSGKRGKRVTIDGDTPWVWARVLFWDCDRSEVESVSASTFTSLGIWSRTDRREGGQTDSGRTIDVASENVNSCFDARMYRSSIRTVASHKMQLYSFVKRFHEVQLGCNLGWSEKEQLHMKRIVPLAFNYTGGIGMPDVHEVLFLRYWHVRTRIWNAQR